MTKGVPALQITTAHRTANMDISTAILFDKHRFGDFQEEIAWSLAQSVICKNINVSVIIRLISMVTSLVTSMVSIGKIWAVIALQGKQI